MPKPIQNISVIKPYVSSKKLGCWVALPQICGILASAAPAARHAAAPAIGRDEKNNVGQTGCI